MRFTMIDWNTEDVHPLATLAEMIPALPKPSGEPRHPSVKSLYRWSLYGCRGIILETVQIRATRCSSLAAVDRFSRAITAARDAKREQMAKQREAETAALRRGGQALMRQAKAGLIAARDQSTSLPGTEPAAAASDGIGA
jgi:hypothetical protein